MRRLIALSACALLLGPQPSFAQPPKRGTIEGRIINASTGKPQRRVEVTLTATNSNGEQRFRRTAATEADGKYSFEKLEVGDGIVYTVDATYDGGTFAGGALRLPDDTSRPPVITTTLRVRETTSDPTVILIRRDNVFIVPKEEGGGIGVIESVTVINDSNRAYIGRGAKVGGTEEGSQPTLGFALPAEAQDGSFGIVRSDIDIPQIVRTDFGFAATVAIPPGDFNTIYSYELEGTAGTYDLSRSALYPIIEFSAFAAEGMSVESNRLRSEGMETVGDRRYEKWTATDYLDPGDTVAINVLQTEGGGLTIVAGAAALGLLLLTMAGYVLARRRRGGRKPEDGHSRDELLVAIAELDVRKEAGELSADEWAVERDKLKTELEGAQGARIR